MEKRMEMDGEKMEGVWDGWGGGEMDEEKGEMVLGRAVTAPIRSLVPCPPPPTHPPIPPPFPFTSPDCRRDFFFSFFSLLLSRCKIFHLRQMTGSSLPAAARVVD